MSRWFPCIWLPSTIFQNLSYAVYVFKRGIKNLWKWLPIIFFDHWYNWSTITEILQFKFGDMAENIKKRGCHVNHDRDAHRLLICAILCKRINDDAYEGTVEQQIYSQQNDLRYLCKIMDKHLFSWWD